jgi:hypothetical protein
MPHFHVYAGTVGCLPDGFPVAYDTRDEAIAAMHDDRDVYLDMGYDVTGNDADGYSILPVNRLYVEECDNPECLEE